jgi:predicted CXXCH cytochrome family protein
MSQSGADMLCQGCHTVINHHIAGKGIDLRIEEGVTPTCQQCHSSTPHGDETRDTHAQRVACQSCHIPRFGKDVSTEMSRDWRTPVWNPAGCGGQGAWIGEEVRASNAIPNYTFWNGDSFAYDLADPISPEPGGYYMMAKALGNIQDGVLYPIKTHTAWQPRHDASGRIVQYDVRWNFWTGFFEEAAARGVEFMGLTGSYTWVETRAQQLITHGVAPANQAVSCSACHTTHTQMTPLSLGYALKGPVNTVCRQCHGNEDMPSFYDLHDKHVKDKEKDCSWCHTFSRPERGLEMP